MSGYGYDGYGRLFDTGGAEILTETKYHGVYICESEDGNYWLTADNGSEVCYGLVKPTEAQIEKFADECRMELWGY